MYQEVSIELPGVKVNNISGQILTSNNLTDYNSFENPNVIKPQDFKDAKMTKSLLKVKLPAKSIVTLTLK